MIEEHKQLSQLPEGWVWTRLAKVGVVASGGTPSTKDEGNFGGEIPWLTPADLTNFQGKFISRGKRNLTKRGLDSSSAVLLPSGTILFSSRAPIGYVAIAGNPISTNQGFKNLVPLNGIFDEFVFYYLRSSKQLAESYASGTTFSEISGARFGQLPFPLPPLPEQHRIVAKIEELFSRLEAGVDALNKIKLQLKQYRQAVLKHGFEGKLTEEWREAHKSELKPTSVLLERIKEERSRSVKGRNRELPSLDKSDLPALPEGWMWTSLGEFTQTVEKISPKVMPEEEFTYIDIASIDGRSIVAPKKYLGKEAPSRARQLVKSGDVLFSTVRTYLKHIAMVGERYDGQIASTGFCVIRPWSCIDNKLIFYLVQTGTFLNPLTQIQRGTSYPAVRNSDVFAQPVPLPTLPEQHKIVEEIDRCFSVADAIEKDVGQSLKQAERLRQSILKRAFEGELVPQDPTDEPAEKLLERIKAEKSKRYVEKKSTGKTRRS